MPAARSVCVVIAARHPATGVGGLLDQLGSAPTRPDGVVIVRSGAPPSAPGPAFSPPPGLVVRVVDVPELGVAVARNVGLTVAGTEVVCFLDDDVQVQPGWLDAITAPFAEPAVGLVGGSVVPVFPAGRAPRWLPDVLLEPFYAARDASSPRSRPFGPNMAVLRSAALAVGGFPTPLGPVGPTAGFHEETQLGHRLVGAGWAARDAPGAVVHHVVPPAHARRRWLLRRAWAFGRSDARRDRLVGRTEPLTRLAKGSALVAAIPLAAAIPGWRWYVPVRATVNAAYLAELVAGGRGVRSRAKRAAVAPAPQQVPSGRATAP